MLSFLGVQVKSLKSLALERLILLNGDDFVPFPWRTARQDVAEVVYSLRQCMVSPVPICSRASLRHVVRHGLDQLAVVHLVAHEEAAAHFASALHRSGVMDKQVLAKSPSLGPLMAVMTRSPFGLDLIQLVPG